MPLTLLSSLSSQITSLIGSLLTDAAPSVVYKN